MKLLCIDPGTTHSGVVILNNKKDILFSDPEYDNHKLCLDLQCFADFENCDHLAIEMIASYGMAVGKEVFETCLFIGRFIQAFNKEYTKIYRKDVKMNLCHSMQSKIQI